MDNVLWLTTKDVEALTQHKHDHIYRAVKAGKLKANRMAGTRGGPKGRPLNCANYRFKRQWVDDWMEGKAPKKKALDTASQIGYCSP